MDLCDQVSASAPVGLYRNRLSCLSCFTLSSTPPPSLYLSLWPLPQVSPVAPRAVLQLRLECARDPEPGSPDHPLACGMLAEPKGGGRFCTSDMSVYLEFSTADPKFPSGKVTESVKITMFSEKPMVHRFLLWPASQKAMVLPLPAVREGDAGRDQRLRGAQQRAPLPCVPPPPVRAAFLWCLLSLLFKTGVACKPQNGIHLLLFRTHGVSLREPRRSIKILSHIPTSHIIVLLNAGRFHGGWGTQRDAPATDNGLPRVRRRHHGAIADAVSRVPGTREDAADLLRGTTGGAGGGGSACTNGSHETVADASMLIKSEGGVVACLSVRLHRRR